MAVNRKAYKIIEVLNLDEKLYQYNATCNHPLLVAMRHLVLKTQSKDLIKKGKITCSDIYKFLDRVKIYRSQFQGRSLKHGQMQEKLLLKLQTFASRNIVK